MTNTPCVKWVSVYRIIDIFFTLYQTSSARFLGVATGGCAYSEKPLRLRLGTLPKEGIFAVFGQL
jgi:hypothetical protein